MKICYLPNNLSEYRKMSRLLGGEDDIKSVLSERSISKALMENGIKKLANIRELILSHDPCSIRKPYSSNTEYLGKVRALDNKIINGCSTLNSIALDFNVKI